MSGAPTTNSSARHTSPYFKWSPDELQKIAASDGLHISPFRDDGVTYGTPTWIWSVVVETACMFAATTEGSRVGIRLPCGGRPAASARLV
jgi:Uncharacterized protein conserved in bacteria (DUF2255)